MLMYLVTKENETLSFRKRFISHFYFILSKKENKMESSY